MASALPLERTWNEARALATRLQEGTGFRQYVAQRLPFVAAAGALFLLLSVCCAAGTVIFFAGMHNLLALPGLLLAPFVLLGSLFVQFYVFFAWLEGRALAQALRRRRKARFALGALPPVPWIPAILFFFLPLVLLAAVLAR